MLRIPLRLATVEVQKNAEVLPFDRLRMTTPIHSQVELLMIGAQQSNNLFGVDYADEATLPIDDGEGAKVVLVE